MRLLKTALALAVLTPVVIVLIGMAQNTFTRGDEWCYDKYGDGTRYCWEKPTPGPEDEVWETLADPERAKRDRYDVALYRYFVTWDCSGPARAKHKADCVRFEERYPHLRAERP